MLVFVVWYAAKLVKAKQNRRHWREPKKIVSPQDKEKQDCLSQLGAKQWDKDADYRIYRIVLPDNESIRNRLDEIAIQCQRVGLHGPLYGERDGKVVSKHCQIQWQGIGGGIEKRVNAKIARQTAEWYIREKLDLLAQIRLLAGLPSQFEAWNLPDVSAEMREKWTALLTPELERWKQYLASKASESSEASAAYQKAIAIVSAHSQHVAFIGERIGYSGITKPKKAEPIRIVGKNVDYSVTRKAIRECTQDASLIVATTLDKTKETPIVPIDDDRVIVGLDMNRHPIYLKKGYFDPLY